MEAEIAELLAMVDFDALPLPPLPDPVPAEDYNGLPRREVYAIARELRRQLDDPAQRASVARELADAPEVLLAVARVLHEAGLLLTATAPATTTAATSLTAEGGEDVVGDGKTGGENEGEEEAALVFAQPPELPPPPLPAGIASWVHVDGGAAVVLAQLREHQHQQQQQRAGANYL